jgi:hypothetical protein
MDIAEPICSLLFGMYSQLGILHWSAVCLKGPRVPYVSSRYPTPAVF